MRRSPTMRIATIAMVLCLIMSCAVFGSVAKYTSSAKGTATGTVAAWSIKVDDADIATTDTVTFDLFDSNTKVAPGTAGSFTATITNASDVTAKIELVLKSTETGADIPVQYSTDGSTWKDSLAELNDTFELAAGAEKEIEIFWQWTTTTDEADTAVGVAAAAGEVNVAVEMTVIATQVN